MNTTPVSLPDDHQLEAWQAEGLLCLDDVIDTNTLARLRALADRAGTRRLVPGERAIEDLLAHLGTVVAELVGEQASLVGARIERAPVGSGERAAHRPAIDDQQIDPRIEVLVPLSDDEEPGLWITAGGEEQAVEIELGGVALIDAHTERRVAPNQGNADRIWLWMVAHGASWDAFELTTAAALDTATA